MNLDVNVKSKTIKAQDLEVGKIFLNGAQKTLPNGIDQLDSIKIKKMSIRQY